jgi:hypothetical protein
MTTGETRVRGSIVSDIAFAIAGLDTAKQVCITLADYDGASKCRDVMEKLKAVTFGDAFKAETANRPMALNDKWKEKAAQ